MENLLNELLGTKLRDTITPPRRYRIVCDNCKRLIRTTEDVRDSYADGRCTDCQAEEAEYSRQLRERYEDE